MEQHDDGRAGRPGQLAHEGGAPPGQLDLAAGWQRRRGVAGPRTVRLSGAATFEDLHAERARGRLVAAPMSPARWPDEGLAERRAGGDHVELVVALLDVADEVGLGVVVGVAVVDDGDDDARADDALGRALDDLAVVQDRVELADAALHVALLVLGRLVVAVLRQVAQLAGPLDGLRDLDAAARREVLVLGLEPLVGAPGELVDIGHGQSRVPPGLTLHPPIGED